MAEQMERDCGGESCQSCEGCAMASGSVRGFDVVSSSDELRGMLAAAFTDQFMRANTNFDTFEAFRFSSAVVINWEADVLIYARERLDSFVQESTRFSTWDDMVQCAGDQYLREA